MTVLLMVHMYCSKNEQTGRHPLKVQCHKIFGVWFFSWISFTTAPKYVFEIRNGHNGVHKGYGETSVADPIPDPGSKNSNKGEGG
jgi:hypothetical protein